MDSRTKTIVKAAQALERRGLTAAAIEVHTPDGRTWQIAASPAGRGRRPDGSWGPSPGAPNGYRLFEMDVETGGSDEHDAVDGDTWELGNLLDYLDAVGQPKDTTH